MGAGAQPYARGQRLGPHRPDSRRNSGPSPPDGGLPRHAGRRRRTAENFERTYGPIKRDPLAAFRPVQKRERPDFAAEQWEIAPEYLLVDGYNIIFAWDELNAPSPRRASTPPATG